MKKYFVKHLHIPIRCFTFAEHYLTNKKIFHYDKARANRNQKEQAFRGW